MECPHCKGRAILKWLKNKYEVKCCCCDWYTPCFEDRLRCIAYIETERQILAEGLVPCPNCHPESKIKHPDLVCDVCNNTGKCTMEVGRKWWLDFDYFVLGHFNEEHTEEAYMKENQDYAVCKSREETGD